VIRLTLLWLIVSTIALYAWKDWYKALCALIIMMAVIEHPDMPKSMFGFQGMNPWNFLLLVVFMAWLVNRNREGLKWDMPNSISWLFTFYILIVFIGFLRMLSDTGGMNAFAELMGTEKKTAMNYWSELIINCIKWVIPGILIFDGCRSRQRFTYRILSILGIYTLLALLVIKAMPLGSITDAEYLQRRALKVLIHNIGYHRVNLSMMLSGAFWGVFALREYAKSRQYKFLLLLVCFITFLGMALTGGRMGYITWACVGFILCLVRWRKYIIVAPLLVISVAILIPSTVERMNQGFVTKEDSNPAISKNEEINTYEVTSGRNLAWPYVIDKIEEAPFVGFGREAMINTGISGEIIIKYGEAELFPHPHNAYLQWLLDNGLIGSIPVFVFYLLFTKYSFILFRDSRNPIFITIGGVTLSLLLALFFASFGSQTFYPREGAVGMWCAMGLMLRVYVERSRILEKTDYTEEQIKTFWHPAT